MLSFRVFDINYRSPLLGRQDDEQNLKYVSTWKMLREKSQVSREVTELTDVDYNFNNYVGTRHLWNEDRQCGKQIINVPETDTYLLTCICRYQIRNNRTSG